MHMMSYHFSQHADRRRGFTLVELIMVIAIMVVIAGITSLVIIGLRPPGSRQGAMLQLSQVMEEGRLSAMEQSTTIYVAIADETHPDEEKRLRAHLLFREYTNEEKEAMQEPPPASQVKALTEWVALPKGYFIDAARPDTLTAESSVKRQVSGLPDNPESVYAIAFGSLGQVSKPALSPLPPLVVMPAELVEASGQLKKLSNSEASAFTLQLNRFTGRVKTYDGLPVEGAAEVPAP